MGSIELRVLIWQLHGGNEEVVLLVARVGAQDEPVDGVVFAFRSVFNNSQ